MVFAVALGLFSDSEDRRGFPALATVTAKSSYHQRPVFPTGLFGARPIVLGPSSPS